MKYYVVKKGRKPGIYTSWTDCEIQIKGYPGAVFKSFKSIQDAEFYLKGDEIKEENAEEKTEDILTKSPFIYVDGSFNKNCQIYGYGGFLNYFDEKSQTRKEIVFQGNGADSQMVSMQNIAGEIAGAMAGVQKALDLGLKKLIVYYDNTGIEMWATGDWDRTKTGTKAYHAFMQDAMKQIDIRFVKVKAHSGIKGNERADKLAKEAVGIGNPNFNVQIKNKEECYVSVAVTGRVYVPVKKSDLSTMKNEANQIVTNMDFGELEDIDWNICHIENSDGNIID